MNGALVAWSRFGYGPGPDGANGIGSDPRGWLKSQLAPSKQAFNASGLPDSASLVVRTQHAQRLRFQMKKEMGMMDGPGMASPGMANPGDMADESPLMAEAKAAHNIDRATYMLEIERRTSAAVSGDTPLVERLVAFWSNHFTISSARAQVLPIAGAFEREVIRPNITGRFHDLLLAVAQHPAMAYYLDSAVSVGPNSELGRHSHFGVNENLGREMMELHTLGVDGGYTEDDVRALARILTGWTVAKPEDAEPGRFRFRAETHEPGDKILLGRKIPEGGVDEGLAAIAMLASHPSTGHFIATKLARHFVADDPPDAVVDRLAQAFRDSDGDLRVVTETLIDSRESWDRYGSKVKSPYDLMVSSARALGADLAGEDAARACNVLGQPFFMAPSPAGWPDDTASWIAPEAVLRRVQWLQAFARHTPPPSMVDAALLDGMRRGAPGPASQGRPLPGSATVALLLSPEFQRR